MKQYILKDNKLTLKVKKTSLYIRLIMFFFSFLFFLLPLMVTFSAIAMGNRFHIGFLFGLFFFGLLGFYLLRVALWNTYGKEELIFAKNKITYLADYGWFRDSIKIKEIIPQTYSVKSIGYKNENKGVLVIGKDDKKIECVTVMPTNEIKELIITIEKHSKEPGQQS
ncbi:MAG TPA: hypothetical protein ENK46_06300 [Flavobacteriia bacterium]|nr:hypothetical protein [Flavobacteriia bacterium]